MASNEKPTSKDDEPVGRRHFFRKGLSQLLRPLAAAAQPLERAAREIAKLDRVAEPAARPLSSRLPLDIWLRPPGALIENRFRETCSLSGQCVHVCPVQAIQIDATGKKGNGKPFIDADVSACAVCDGLKCMSACPSGALVPTSINDIDMGTAVWNESSCLRTRGENCTICIDRCPLGSAAIELKNEKVAVKPLGCIGCGVCQHDCPTTPRSIVVIPIAAKSA